MPLLEAMACGRPVITTAAGPAVEFCPPEASYFVSAKEERVTDPAPPFGEFTSEWTWLEPNAAELAAALRAVYEDRGEAARRGQIAAQRIIQTHSWPSIAKFYFDRIARLTSSSSSAAMAEVVQAAL